MKRLIGMAVLLMTLPLWAAQQYSASGMVMKIDAPHKMLLISCDAIPGYMEAMTMPFEVRDSKDLQGLAPGTMVSFTLTVDEKSSYADHVEVRPYESVEQDPLTARRLTLLSHINHPAASPKLLAVGETVPDFTLSDQVHKEVSLSQYTGKVVALNFIYTSCALPNYCYRISNNFGVLQRRFKGQLGRDLVLLTVTFDPQRDQAEQLAHYAENWKADPATWHFLTGTVSDVRRVTDMFGIEYFPDEGLMNHSLHTAVIDRQRKLVANIEGNQFTADQLADLVKTVMTAPGNHKHGNQLRSVHNPVSEASSSNR